MDNISKKVLSLEDKQIIGYVLNIAVDYSKKVLTGYYIADEDENIYLLKMEHILAVEDLIVIDSTSNLEFVQDDGEDFRKRVVDENGRNYGRILSLTFDKLKIKKVITDRCELLGKYIAEIGKDVVFVSFKKKRNHPRIFPRTDREDIVVQTMRHEEPVKVTLSSKNFIGKIAYQTLLGYNNELIVRKGDKITKQIFEKAKKHNKLNQLFFILLQKK